MAENKTQPTTRSVDAFLQSIDHDKRRADSMALCALLREITGQEPILWGTAIVGFGRHKFPNGSGKETDWFALGFSPRKQALTLYIMAGFQRFKPLMDKLGKYKNSVSCLYINKLEDVDPAVLKELLESAWQVFAQKPG